ncbi:MAG: hypothetical protein HC822_21315 [Oscillochloris sp.]|nr:hypothetical protein [Oscillochloris sp.]
MRSFQGNLSEFFFGREVLVKRLADRCDSSLFLAVLGPSGSGKSSLVFAGLVPELQRREPQLPLISLTPNELPLAALLFAIEQANLPEIKEVRRQAILVIDQFEEAFTLCQDNDERRAFFAELLRLQGRFLVIITMRADFLGEVAPYPELRDRVQSQQELVAPMTPEELRRAMELQAAAVGLRFEADLSGQILDDVRGEPGAMPLLQHALQELWQRRRGRWLRSAEYRVIGGIQQAIAHSADEIYNGSSAEDQERLRGIFVRLTRLDHDHQGDEQRDTRRRVQLHDLVPSGVDPAPIRALISRLANARLVVTSGGSDSDSVEVAHEALIRSWPRLRNWLSEDRQNLLLLEAIRTAVRDWHSSGEDEGLLFRGSRLDEALALLHNQHLGLNADEQRFIEAGIALREREDAQREAARQRELEQARALAAEQEERARAERLRAEEAAAATRQLRQRAVFLAGVAVVALVAMIAAGIGFVQAAVQSGIAQSNAERAESQAATAEVARSEAEAQQQTAEAANVEAQEQRTRADTSAAESAQLAIIGDAEAALNGGRIDRSLALALAAVESGNPLARSVFALAQAADQGARQLFGGFETAVSAVAYSPDGRFVAAGDHFGLVLVWEIGNAEPIRRYQHEGPQDVGATITEVLFTADNNVLIATDSGELLLLRAADAVPFAGSDGTPIQYMALSNDGQQVFTLSAEGVLLVWDVATRQEVRTLAVIEDGEIRGMTLGANDRIIVALFADGQPPLDALREFDLETGAEVRTTDLSYATDLTDPEQLSPCFADSLAALPTQPLALVGCENGVIQLRNLNNGRLLRTLVGHDAQVLALAPVGDGSMFVSASLDQTTLLWDTERASVIERYEGHESETQVIAVAPDGERIVTGSFDRTVRLWDLRGGQRIRSYSADIQPPLNNVVTRFSADGSRITALGNERGVIWNREDGIVEAEFAFAGQSVALSPDGSLALLDDGNGLTIYDLERDEVISSLTGRPEQSVVAAFSNDNQLLVTVFDLTNAQLWDVTDGSPILDLKLEDDVLLSRAIAFNQTGTQIIGADENTIDPLIWIWDVASGTIVQRLSGHSDLISAVAFSADGTLAISGAWDRSVRIWDVSSGEELQRLIGHSQAVKSVALSADNQLVLSGSDDRTARLWEVAGGSELARYSGFNSTLVTVVFGPDGETALTSSATGDVVLWRAPSVAALVDWVYANRYLPELSCEELEQYNLTCD